MAEKKSQKSDQGEVVKVPLAIIAGKDGRHHHLYQGAQVAADAFDADHLKLLREEGSIGAPDEAEDEITPLGATPGA